MEHNAVARIDFGPGKNPDAQVKNYGCISIFPKRPELPSDHSDIRLRNTLMFHAPYVKCGGSIERSDNGREGLVCSGCNVFWSFPPERVTLGELVEIFHHRGFACVWQHSRKVVCDGSV